MNCRHKAKRHLMVLECECATSITRSPAIARRADCAGCQWLSRSSRINDFYFIRPGVCHFLL